MTDPHLITFLYGARLIPHKLNRKPLINLRRADLSNAQLTKAKLRFADLRGVVLRNADLREADLAWTNFIGADLRGADLRGADLKKVVLSDQSYPSMADLRGANLDDANLTGAYERAQNKDLERLITNEELERQAASLQNAILPDGQKYEDWIKHKEGHGDHGENIDAS